MGLFNKKKEGGFFADVIRCDEPSYLIWKWHPKDTVTGENKRENEIRWGSSLRVKDGSVAVFVYKQKDGTMQDYIVGPYDDTIKTKNFPILSSLIGTVYDGVSPFQAEIYFINLAEVVQTKLGVPFFDVFDPQFQDYAVPVASRGMLSFKITDCQGFIKKHRLEQFDLVDFKNQIKDAAVKYLKDAISNAPLDYGIPVIQIERKILTISNKVEEYLKERLARDFAVDVTGFDIEAIEIDKSSPEYNRLLAVTKDIVERTTLTEANLNIQRMTEDQRIDLVNKEEALRIQREEDQFARHMQSKNANIAAYQVEKQAEVGIAGAEALGNLSANGATEISNGGTMNPAGMMAGIAMGGAISQNITNTMNNMINGVNSVAGTGNGIIPPPIPVSVYNVVINGQSAGPYDIATLSNMYISNAINDSTLVWKQGMTEWLPLCKVEELAILKETLQTPPPIPKEGDNT